MPPTTTLDHPRPMDWFTYDELRVPICRPSGPIFFSAIVPPDKEATYEVPDRRRQGFEETLHLETVPQVVGDALQRLNDFEREIVTRRFGIGTSGETLAEIGSQVGLSHERVRQIEARALGRLSYSGELRETYEELALVGGPPEAEWRRRVRR